MILMYRILIIKPYSLINNLAYCSKKFSKEKNSANFIGMVLFFDIVFFYNTVHKVIELAANQYINDKNIFNSLKIFAKMVEFILYILYFCLIHLNNEMHSSLLCNFNKFIILKVKAFSLIILENTKQD